MYKLLSIINYIYIQFIRLCVYLLINACSMAVLCLSSVAISSHSNIAYTQLHGVAI